MHFKCQYTQIYVSAAEYTYKSTLYQASITESMSLYLSLCQCIHYGSFASRDVVVLYYRGTRRIFLPRDPCVPQGPSPGAGRLLAVCIHNSYLISATFKLAALREKTQAVPRRTPAYVLMLRCENISECSRWTYVWCMAELEMCSFNVCYQYAIWEIWW